MLKLTSYFQKLNERLSHDTRLQDRLRIYLSDAGTDCVQKTEQCITHFQQCRLKQWEHNEELDSAYDRAFNELAYLAMRLGYLSVLSTEKIYEQPFSEKETECCRRCAKQLLTELCTTTDWITQGKNGNLFQADLWTGSLCAQTAVLYTILAPYCSTEERSVLQQGMIHNGIEAVYKEWLDLSDHRHALDSMGHNWWLVIVCGAAVCALSLRDELPLCADYFNKITQLIPLWFRYPGNVLQNKKANFGPEGDYIEFLGYMTYGFSTYAMLESFYREQTGDSSLFEEEFLRPQLNAYLSQFYWSEGELRLSNFGDTPERIVKHQHVIYYLAERFGDRTLFDWQSLMSDGPNEYEDFLFYAPAANLPAAPPVDLPKISVYSHSGYAVVRTGQGKEDRFFAIKTGEIWNHNHLDTGTFLLSDGGTEIAVDSGTCSYGRPEYRGYYSTSQAHNVVLYNGLGPDPDMIDSGTKFPGTFPAFIESDDHSFTYLLADCTGPYTRCFSRFYRHLVFLQNWILFVDDIQAYEPGSLEWRMHYSGHLITGNGQTFLRNSGCETPFYPLYPTDQKLSTGIGYRDGEMLSMRGMRDPERQRKQQEALPTGNFLTLTSTMNGRRAKLVQAIGRPRSSDCRIAPSVKTFDGGFRITFQGSSFTEEVLINTRADGSYMHRNSWLTVDGLETDAFLVYTKRRTSSSLCDVALVNGSCLKLDDAFRLGCLMKIDGHFDLERKQGVVCSGMNQPLTLSAPLPVSVSLQEGRHSLHW